MLSSFVPLITLDGGTDTTGTSALQPVRPTGPTPVVTIPSSADNVANQLPSPPVLSPDATIETPPAGQLSDTSLTPVDRVVTPAPPVPIPMPSGPEVSSPAVLSPSAGTTETSVTPAVQTNPTLTTGTTGASGSGGVTTLSNVPGGSLSDRLNRIMQEGGSATPASGSAMKLIGLVILIIIIILLIAKKG